MLYLQTICQESNQLHADFACTNSFYRIAWVGQEIRSRKRVPIVNKFGGNNK